MQRPITRRQIVRGIFSAGAGGGWLLARRPLPVAAQATSQVEQPVIDVRETDDAVDIETDALHATIRKRGYVSGIAAGSLVDKKTGAKDLGFGLHIMDFLLAPGWRDDGYERNPSLHGDLPKHYVEGPQICTRARRGRLGVSHSVTIDSVR